MDRDGDVGCEQAVPASPWALVTHPDHRTPGPLIPPQPPPPSCRGRLDGFHRAQHHHEGTQKPRLGPPGSSPTIPSSRAEPRSPLPPPPRLFLHHIAQTATNTPCLYPCPPGAPHSQPRPLFSPREHPKPPSGRRFVPAPGPPRLPQRRPPGTGRNSAASGGSRGGSLRVCSPPCSPKPPGVP